MTVSVVTTSASGVSGASNAAPAKEHSAHEDEPGERDRGDVLVGGGAGVVGEATAHQLALESDSPALGDDQADPSHDDDEVEDDPGRRGCCLAQVDEHAAEHRHDLAAVER
jgi:hypothetical protein